MNPDFQYFNSDEAAKILNVNVSSIKRWTEEGELECVKTVGGHRKFLIQHLAKFLERHQTKISKANIFPVENETDLEISLHTLRGDYQFLVNYVYEQARLCSRTQVQRVFNGLYLGQTPLYAIYDKLVTPVLYQVGNQWEKGELTIIEEHLTTQTIRDCLIRLQGVLQLPTQKIGKALCLMMSTELHDIALKMVDHILEIRGYQTYYSGQLTPSIKIEKVFETFRPDRVYISSTAVPDLNIAQAEFDKICYVSAAYKATVIVGGRGFDMIEYQHPAVSRRIFTFEEVYLT
jgi:excisionase family DNA binding protein